MARKRTNPEVEAMVSGARFLSDFVAKFTDAVVKRGGKLADVHCLITKDGEEVFNKMVDVAISVSAPVFSRDMRERGWKPLEHTSRRITSVADLELVSFLKPGEDRINGEEMVRRARHELNANLGQEDAEWLMEHQDQIPAEFRNFYLTFPGTVWQDSDGDRCVPCLYWYDGRWCLDFYWLEVDWISSVRLLRSRK